MNIFLILITFLFASYSFSFEVLHNKESRATCKLKSTLERVFLRKKRFLLLPNNGAIKVTLVIAKSLIAKYPKGFSLSMEVSAYYPGPSMREELIPKKFRGKTTVVPTPKSASIKYIDIPNSSDNFGAEKAIWKPKIQHIDRYGNSTEWIDNRKLFKKYYPEQLESFNRLKSGGYKEDIFLNDGSNVKKKMKLKVSGFKSPKVNLIRAYKSNRNFLNPEMLKPSINEIPKVDQILTKNPFHFPDMELFQKRRHYRAHRKRREIFYYLEGFSLLLGFDVKMCILRSICESKRFLLPPGYSVMQDIVRILLLLPTMNEMDDDYSRAIRADVGTCDQSFRKQCPFSLLDWLMNPTKTV